MRIIYALAGQGRGHTSRVKAVSSALRRRGHTVVFCCGGTAQTILEEEGETVIAVPVMAQILHDNKVDFLRTAQSVAGVLLEAPQILNRLTEQFAEFRPDLLITDFEVFSPRAASRLRLPILSFNHQQVVTHTRYTVPLRHQLDALRTRTVINMVIPRNARHNLVSSFYFPEVRNPANTTLIPPILREEIRDMNPVAGDHILVYHNDSRGSVHLLELLAQLDAPVVLYNFKPPEDLSLSPNLTFKSPSVSGFSKDLETCGGIISTAGFTLTSEALYLGKPLMVLPNRGIFEQTLNALYLQKEGLGHAVIDRNPKLSDFTRFLARSRRYGRHVVRQFECGNTAAVDCIEAVGNASQLVNRSKRPGPSVLLPQVAKSQKATTTPRGPLLKSVKPLTGSAGDTAESTRRLSAARSSRRDT
jgi:uncharacterized protein (TIGR00661 family)